MAAPSETPSESATSSTQPSPGSVTRTEVLPATSVQQPEAPTLRLTLSATPSQTNRRVSWNAETIDNEHMNKRKSKCCCIYKKPRQFGESSSESDDDECDNCFGHVEHKKRNKRSPPPPPPQPDDPHPHDEHDEDDGGAGNASGGGQTPSGSAQQPAGI